MWGSDTLTMVVSSTSMKAASVTTTAISQGLPWGVHSWDLPPLAPFLPEEPLTRRSLLHVDGGLDRGPERDRQQRIEPAIDDDLDRHALHDLDEVAGGVLGREGAEG